MKLAIIAVVIAACTPADAERKVSAGERVLARYCVKCHGPVRAESDFGFAHDMDRLVAAGFVVPGDPDASPIVRRIEAGEMPPAGARPTKAEVTALRATITALQRSEFREDADVDRILAADSARLDRETRAHSRWFSLAHLANAGVPEPQLAQYRSALAILLASLTWSPSPRAPVAVDPGGTVFRIDLRELGWSAATWDTIRAAYPYGVARSQGVPDVVRADWFVATASRGALYYAILGIPETEDDLARLLGIDLAANRAAERVVRAGFTSSGVSVNNRIIERHATRFGAYWRSFDFSSSVGFENIFRHPLDFVPAGGELIFNLPDGLQAYMLVDGTGKRIEKAPTTIVSDPRRPDRAVDNALSCFGCHGAGIVDHADEIRDSSRDPRVHRLHPPADDLAKVYAFDRARFTAGLARINATPTADAAQEPLTSLAARYEAALDLTLAAAELGMRPAELTARMARSPTARRDLAALTVAGGTIKRDAWVVAFPRVVAALGLGVAFTPATVGETDTVWIDRDRHTWINVGVIGTRDDAERACIARGATLPRTNELVAAAGQGLASATRSVRAVWTREQRLDLSNQRFSLVVDLATATTTRVSPTTRQATVCIQRRPEVRP